MGAAAAESASRIRLRRISIAFLGHFCEDGFPSSLTDELSLLSSEKAIVILVREKLVGSGGVERNFEEADRPPETLGPSGWPFGRWPKWSPGMLWIFTAAMLFFHER